MTFPFTENGFPSGRGNSDRLKRPKLTISNLSDTGLTASWEAVDTATGYKVFVNQVEVYSGANLTFNVTGLDPWISNIIQVKAFNAEKESSFALFIKASKTLQQPVLSLVSKTDTTINLSGTNPDNLPDVELYQDGVLISEGSLNTWELTGLNPETSYTFTMRVGSGGIWSTMSAPLTVVTDEAEPVDPVDPEPEFEIVDLYGLDDLGPVYDASIMSTVWQDLDGTVPALEGDDVRRIDDVRGMHPPLLLQTGDTPCKYVNRNNVMCLEKLAGFSRYILSSALLYDAPFSIGIGFYYTNPDSTRALYRNGDRTLQALSNSVQVNLSNSTNVPKMNANVCSFVDRRDATGRRALDTWEGEKIDNPNAGVSNMTPSSFEIIGSSSMQGYLNRFFVINRYISDSEVESVLPRLTEGQLIVSSFWVGEFES